MSKAYDRLEWPFIQSVMARFGFNQTWISWVMKCIASASYSYLINGEVRGKVVPTRGIRQGDPLSPYIFILCSEVLSGLVKAAEKKGIIKGVRIARKAPRVSHLLFADDTMFFCRASKKDCSSLKEIIQRYETVSGQRINYEKSSVYFSSKLPKERKEEIKTVLGIRKEGGTGKYLGLPELFGQKKKDLFATICERIQCKIKGWSTRFLSHAGKLTLLKAVLSAIPSYAMTCFKLPGNLCKRIQSQFTRFWWDSKGSKRKMAWVAWKKMTRAKAKGGLGYRDIQAFNNALLAKLSWKILRQPESLMARLLTSKYCKSQSFLDCSLPSNPSHGWRGIMLGRDLLSPNLIKSLGNGKNTNIWSDPWIPSIPYAKPIGPVKQEHQNLLVADLLDSQGNWSKEKVDELLPELTNHILALRPSQFATKDTYHWRLTKSGIYSTKSGYAAAVEEDSVSLQCPQENPPFDWYKQVWNAKCSPKIKSFLWKALNGALSTGENCKKRNLQVEPSCKRCGVLESTEHILFQCEFAEKVWAGTLWKQQFITSGPRAEETLQNCIKLINNLIPLPVIGIKEGALQLWIIWNLWKNRNQFLFQGISATPQELITKSIKETKEWQQAQESQILKHKLPLQSQSQKAQEYKYQVFTDASWNEENQLAGLGIVLQDRDGRIIHQWSRVEPHVPSPLMAEGIALLEAVRCISSMGLTEVSFNSDSKEAIEASRTLNHRDIFGIVNDIRHISNQIELVSFNSIPRSANCTADRLAKLVLSEFLISRVLDV